MNVREQAAWTPTGWLSLVRAVFFPEWVGNRRIRITRAGVVYMAVMFAMAVAAFNTGNNLLYLLLSLLLAGLFTSFIVSESMMLSLWVEREPPGPAVEGMPFHLRYRVENRRKITPAMGLRIIEQVGGRETRAVAGFIAPRGEGKARTSAIAPSRGRYEFGLCVLETAGPFGLFEKAKRVPLPGELLVWPRSRPEEVDLEELAAAGEARPRLRPGRGDELLGFRKYVRGDPAKDIHWKTSARAGELMVREREAEDEPKLAVELLLSRPRPGRHDPKREELVRKTASIAEAGLNAGWSVRVECGGRGVDYGSGPSQLREILTFLALFDDEKEGPRAGSPLPPREEEARVVRVG